MSRQNSLNLSYFNTKLGKLCIGNTTTGLCLVNWVDTKNFNIKLQNLIIQLNAKTLIKDNQQLITTKQQINEYLSGKRQKFTIDLHMVGTPFQKQTWQTLTKVPYGTTLSYKQQAITMNKANAVRAVANANGANHLSIIIPCHRIIASNGSLGGYAGGFQRKAFLLDLEK